MKNNPGRYCITPTGYVGFCFFIVATARVKNYVPTWLMALEERIAGPPLSIPLVRFELN
jgi:hypothetical protein